MELLNIHLSKVSIMGYFEDIEFLGGSFDERCLAQMDRRFAGTCSLEFLASGRMHCSIDGGPSMVISRPCVFWHHPDHRYKYGASDAQGWSHHWILMRGERPLRMLEGFLMPSFPSGFAPLASPELFDRGFHRLLEMILSPGRARHAAAVALLESLLASLASPEAATGAELRFEDLFQSISSAPAKEWNFHYVARSFGLSYGHFRRRFKELSGRSPHDFVLQCRVMRAAELLRLPELQVKEIAAECGCPDQAAFSKAFKARMGSSPESYRKCLPLV